MDAICESLTRALDAQEPDPLILIPVFIHDFLCIRPFNDGNGRMSRLLTALPLCRSGYMVGKYISLENKIARSKGLYYDALARCQQGRPLSTPGVMFDRVCFLARGLSLEP